MRLTAPLHIHWEITNMCNYSCIHCYQKNDKMRYNLSPNQLMDIAMKMVKAGVFQVSISGGEPFLIKNIEDIVSFLVYHNIDVLICSNGSILEDKHIWQVIRKTTVSNRGFPVFHSGKKSYDHAEILPKPRTHAIKQIHI